MNNLKKLWIICVLVLLCGCSVQTNEDTDPAIEEATIQDGSYLCEVSLTGGSGKAKIESPASVNVIDGQIQLTAIWSSSYYDYMIVGGEKYLNEAAEGNSTFTIPVPAFDESFTVIGDTTMMSTPHEIEYQITVYHPGAVAIDDVIAADGKTQPSSGSKDISQTYQQMDLAGLEYIGSLETDATTQFRVDFYQQVEDSSQTGEEQKSQEIWKTNDGIENCYALIQICDQDPFLVVPENADASESIPENMTVLQRPLTQTYIVSTSAMDPIASIGAIDHLKLSGTQQDDWQVDAAISAMQSGSLIYAGKYNAPDYELLLRSKCDLSIENMMITHNPEVKEKLISLEIPVIVERSSYEASPLGRLEWIKLYGVLFGKIEEAKSLYQQQEDRLNELIDQAAHTAAKQRVAFFSITANRSVTVRKNGDYISSMIDMAGGICVPENLEGSENALSTVNIQMEDFYVQAKDADILIYNSTIEDEITSMDQLCQKSELLADFKAVQDQKVYCLKPGYFQQSTHVAEFVADISKILSGDDTNLEYLTKLN